MYVANLKNVAMNFLGRFMQISSVGLDIESVLEITKMYYFYI